MGFGWWSDGRREGRASVLARVPLSTDFCRPPSLLTQHRPRAPHRAERRHRAVWGPLPARRRQEAQVRRNRLASGSRTCCLCQACHAAATQPRPLTQDLQTHDLHPSCLTTLRHPSTVFSLTNLATRNWVPAACLDVPQVLHLCHCPLCLCSPQQGHFVATPALQYCTSQKRRQQVIRAAMGCQRWRRDWVYRGLQARQFLRTQQAVSTSEIRRQR